MARIERVAGKTIIDMGSIQVKTNMINRHRYNDLRKRAVITPEGVLNYILPKPRRKENA